MSPRRHQKGKTAGVRYLELGEGFIPDYLDPAWNLQKPSRTETTRAREVREHNERLDKVQAERAAALKQRSASKDTTRDETQR